MILLCQQSIQYLVANTVTRKEVSKLQREGFKTAK